MLETLMKWIMIFILIFFWGAVLSDKLGVNPIELIIGG